MFARVRGLAVLAALVVSVGTSPAAAAPLAAAPGPAQSPEWWFDSWHLEQLWADGVRGQGVTIAEIDTGVNAQLPELQGRILAGTDLGESGNGQIDRQVRAFGHGTAMASLMVARPGLFGITGIAPDARVLPIAVPLNGTTDADSPDKLDQAIRYAADHGAQVISMSLGGKRSPGLDPDSCPSDEQSAVYHALAKGAVLLAAVGNSGPTNNAVEEPAVCLGVVAVGAEDINGAVASFSSRQPYLSMLAPGVNIPSLGRIAGQAFAGDGTSQATAIASASVALIISRYPHASSSRIVARLLATLAGHHRHPSDTYGYGSLDTYRAVTADVPADAPDPIYAAVAPFLRREATLAMPARIKAPSPAAIRPARTGSATVGSRPGLTPRTELGVAIGAAGVLALVLLAILGRRRRGRTG